MIKKTFFSLIVLLFLNSLIFSQKIDVGIRYEPAIIKTEYNNMTENILALFNLGGDLNAKLTNWLSFDLRSNMMLASNDFSGLETGIFVRLKSLETRFYFETGIYNHFNNGASENTLYSPKKSFLFKSIGLGYYIGKNTSIDLSYNWTSDKNYAVIKRTDWLSYSKNYDKKINAIFKLGFNIFWNIY